MKPSARIRFWMFVSLEKQSVVKKGASLSVLLQKVMLRVLSDEGRSVKISPVIFTKALQLKSHVSSLVNDWSMEPLKESR